MYNTRIKDMREDRDIKQKDIAKFLGVHQTTYSSYELGKLEIPLEHLVRLAEYYNTSVDYLLRITDEQKPYIRNKGKKELCGGKAA